MRKSNALDVSSSKDCKGVPASDAIQRISALTDLVFLHELQEYLATLRPPTPEQIAKLKTLLSATQQRIRELKAQKELQARRGQRKARAATRRKKAERPFSERAGETGRIEDFLAETDEQQVNQRTGERIRQELSIPVGLRPTERALELYFDVQKQKEIDSAELRLPAAELEAVGNLLLDYGGHKAVDSEHARDQIDAAFSFVEGPLAAALIRARSAESETANVEAVSGPIGEAFQPLVDAENVRRENRRVIRHAPLNYVDFFTQATYDVSFRAAEPGRLSTKIQLVYPDGTELVVDLGEIKNKPSLWTSYATPLPTAMMDEADDSSLLLA